MQYKNVARPNFFSVAKSERVQDAFICWLLTWAQPEYATANGPLHQTGRALLDRLLRLHGITLNEVTSLKIKPQRHLSKDICQRVAAKLGVPCKQKERIIDILVYVNGQIALLIEDKTTSGVSEKQLEFYLHGAKELSSRQVVQVVPVYLKTGRVSKAEGRIVRQAGYKMFGRDQLLAVLKEGQERGVKNDIYKDFYDRWNGRRPALGFLR